MTSRSLSEETAPGDSSPGGQGAIVAWMQLVRLPNVFTVLADVGAAFLLVAGSHQPIGRFAVVLSAGVALYWAGMVLNDVFDLEKDKAERSARPLPSGAISVGAARTAGWSLLGLGVLLAAASGYVPDADRSTTWLPAVVGLVLAASIVAYDGPLKSTPTAPAAMGGCRVLSFLLGAAPVLAVADGIPVIPRYVLAIALGFGVYVMGITTLARDEATGGHLVNLRVGFVVMMVGALMLAFAPGLSTPADRVGWSVRSGGQFAMLVLLIVFPIALRGLAAQRNPQPAVIGNLIRVSLLTIIPLAASFAFLGAGPVYGLVVFALVAPAILLSTRLRVT